MKTESTDDEPLASGQSICESEESKTGESPVEGSGEIESKAMNSRGGADFRAEERINVALPVTLKTGWGGSVVSQASTVDLSQRGMRLRANIPLRLGQGLLAIVSEDTIHAKIYRVVWVRQLESGHSTYEAGLEVQTPDNSDTPT